MSKTALIILNYNNPEDTRNCLVSVAEHNTAPVKTIVVDGGSGPDKLDELRQAMSDVAPGYREVGTSWRGTLDEVTLLPLGENVGYARGNNAGLELAYADEEIDRVMILNNDILFVDDIIPALIAAQDTIADCAIISPLLFRRNMDGIDYNCARRAVTVGEITEHHLLSYWWRFRHISMEDAQPGHFLLKTHNTLESLPEIMPIELPSGSCMLVDKEYFKSIGSFDPYTFLYYEENILHNRIARTGCRNYLLTSARCIHLGASTTDASPSRFIMKTSLRSERYWVKYYSGASWPKRMAYHLASLWYKSAFTMVKALRLGRLNK